MAMFTVEYDLFSSFLSDYPDVLRDIYENGKDIATVFETVEFIVEESSEHEYIAVISEKQRNIFLKNMNVLIELYKLPFDEYFVRSGNRISYYGLKKFTVIRSEGWEAEICRSIFSSIFAVFWGIDKELPFAYSNDEALHELTIIIESYLKYLGKEGYKMQITEIVDRHKRFQCEEDLICPIEMDGRIIIPKDMVLPTTLKYEVRRGINGLFFATISEETALEAFNCRKELVKLAYDNYASIAVDCQTEMVLESIFVDSSSKRLNKRYIFYTLMKIITTMAHISDFLRYPRCFYVTCHHLEEIHILAQDCLEIGLFNLYNANFSKEITNSFQLAQLIDANIKTLVPTGSKTKPAIRELYTE